VKSQQILLEEYDKNNKKSILVREGAILLREAKKLGEMN
jgi:hypothetical protein